MIVEITGYHGTAKRNVRSIMKNGFRCRYNNRHWLGQGIYFYKDDIVQAKVWAFNQKRRKEPVAVIAAQIRVDENDLLDLNKRKEVDSFARYVENLLESPETCLKIHIDSDAKKFRCFALDHYAHTYGIKVIICSFYHKNSFLRELDGRLGSELGICYCEQQICVKDQACIYKLELAWSSDSVDFRGYKKKRWHFKLEGDKGG